MGPYVARNEAHAHANPAPANFSRPPRRPLWQARHDFHWLLLPPAVARPGPSYSPWLSIALGWQLLTCRRDVRPCGFQKAADKLGTHNFRTSARPIDHVHTFFVTNRHAMRAGINANMFVFTHSCSTTFSATKALASIQCLCRGVFSSCQGLATKQTTTTA